MQKKLNKVARDTNTFLKNYLRNQKQTKLIDPIKYGLLFSRFLRSDAKDYPDIDYDVSDAFGLKEILAKENLWHLLQKNLPLNVL